MFLSLLLFFKKNKNTSDSILAAYFLLAGINILFSYLEYDNVRNDFRYPCLIHITTPLVFLHGPLLWLYVRALTVPRFTFKKWYYLHFAPFAFAVILLSFLYYSVPQEIKVPYVKSEVFKEDFHYKLIVVLIAVLIYFYLFWCIRLIRGYKKKLLNLYSNVEKIDLKWIKFMLFIAVIIYGFAMTTNLLDLFLHFISFQNFQAYAFLINSLFILVLGFYGHRQTTIFTSDIKSQEDIFNLKPASLKEDISDNNEKFAQKLLNHMDYEKPFTDQELSIGKLAKQLSVPAEYLSHVINSCFGKNFFDFINTYRIEEFKRQLQNPDNQNYKIIGIAYDCGFNSKATFNRVFKNHAGLTPSQYKQSISYSR